MKQGVTKKFQLRFLFASMALAGLSGVASAEAMKINLHCLTGGNRPTTSFAGWLFVDSEADIQNNADGMMIKGRKVSAAKAKIDNPKCPYLSYQKHERHWNVISKRWEDWETTAVRDFNAISIEPKGSVTFFTCGAGSQLEVYDDLDSWNFDLYRQYGSGLVASEECVTHQ